MNDFTFLGVSVPLLWNEDEDGTYVRKLLWKLNVLISVKCLEESLACAG